MTTEKRCPICGHGRDRHGPADSWMPCSRGCLECIGNWYPDGPEPAWPDDDEAIALGRWLRGEDK